MSEPSPNLLNALFALFPSDTASVLLLRERGNGNTHTLLIVQSCLGDVIEKAATQQEQLEAIHKTLKEWGATLFADGALEKAFNQAGLGGGV